MELQRDKVHIIEQLAQTEVNYYRLLKDKEVVEDKLFALGVATDMVTKELVEVSCVKDRYEKLLKVAEVVILKQKVQLQELKDQLEALTPQKPSWYGRSEHD